MQIFILMILLQFLYFDLMLVKLTGKSQEVVSALHLNHKIMNQMPQEIAMPFILRYPH